MAVKKHTTLCFECEWAGGKDGKCPWASSFSPVPGWKAEPTKIHCRDNKKEYIDSFDVYECPLFELMHEIKEGIVKDAGKDKRAIKQREKELLCKKIKELRESGETVEKIAEKLYYDPYVIYRLLKKIKESEENE